MVKWSSSWLEHTDESNKKMKIRLWAVREDYASATCVVSQLSKRKNHKELCTAKFGKNSKHVSGQQSSSRSKPVLTVDIIHDKLFAAQALWLLKVAEDDLTPDDCDSTSALFQHMFPDSSISQGFMMCCQEASYLIQDGLGPLMSKYACSEVLSSSCGFMLLFDETTVQSRKQMDLLICFWLN